MYGHHWKPLPEPIDAEKAERFLKSDQRDPLNLGMVRLVAKIAGEYVRSQIFWQPALRRRSDGTAAHTPRSLAYEDLFSAGLLKVVMLVARTKEVDGKFQPEDSIDRAKNIPAFLAEAAKNQIHESHVENTVIRIPRTTRADYRARGEPLPISP